MNIKEIPNTNLKVDIQKYPIDEILGEKIDEALPSRSFFMGLIGAPASGKTTLSLSLLCCKSAYRKIFDTIIFVSPKLITVRELKKKYVPEVYHYEELSTDNMDEIDQLITNSFEDGNPSLLLIDDMLVHLKEIMVERWLVNKIVNRRHEKLSIIITSQIYNKIPLAIRKLFTNVALFNTKSKKELEAMYDEFNCTCKEKYYELMRYIYKKPHDFAFFDLVNSTIYRNFNKLLY